MKALADQGYMTVEVHKEAQTLYDYCGKPRPQKEGRPVGDAYGILEQPKVPTEVWKATVIVRRKFVGGAANDVGFIKNSKGYYEAIISDYDSNKHNAAWMTNLTKAYAKHGLIKQAGRMGMTFIGQKLDTKGRPQLQFAVAR